MAGSRDTQDGRGGRGTPTRPNILLITSDQHHASCLGSVNPRISTPALDRLAREGTRFDRAYSPSPVCTPARASIITGLYPSVHGAWTIGVKLPEDALSDHGYATGLIGKAHFQPLASTPESSSLEAQPTLRDLDFWRGFHGPWYGFDHVEVCRNHADESHAGQHYALWLEEQGLANWRDYFVSWPPDPAAPSRHGAWDLPEALHYNVWIADRANAFVDRAASSDQPFFLWASFPDPHPPYLVPEPWASMYDPASMEPGALVPGEHAANPPHFGLTQTAQPDFSPWKETFANHGFHSHLGRLETLRRDMAIYYGMVSFMDREIGRMLDHLDRSGLAQNTLVVFTTDHGHFLGQHGLAAKGAFHYEDLLRLPFLVRWPEQEGSAAANPTAARVPAGRVSTELQSTVDLAPTFLSAAGLAVPGLMQGYDQLPVWCPTTPSTPASPSSPASADAPSVTRAQGAHVAPRDHVIVENRHQPTKLHLRTYVEQRYKLTVYRGAPYGELFDLEADPGETRNLWESPDHAALRAELLHRAVQYEIEREPTRMPRVAGA
jgi:arylsulfatase A-like enzyme